MDDYMGDELSFGSEKDAPIRDEVDPDHTRRRLHTILARHALVEHRVLGLLSQTELEGLHDVGGELLRNLIATCDMDSIELRHDQQPIAVRAAAVYGTILDAPVAIALVLAFPKGACTRVRYWRIRDAVVATAVQTVGDLLRLLSQSPEIRDMTQEERTRLCTWLGTHIFC